ncbi:MAG: alanine--tRNA ligase [Clostridia bacterium]|nr:alanine--tRNA ligase [Clostridia bacterium]
MEKFGLNELREMFLSFFETKGHLRLPSFSLIPQNDPSLLLINAGMSPMKTWFTGEEEPPCLRVCTCQKCIRTGDIENIGKTARHGTYFEMLGNFSFGDYFKHEAIAWGWEFLTSPDWVGIDPDLLYPSVYLDDDEAWNIWHDEIGIPADRIFRFGKEDNFWEHGSGPCGPCSEIYYDRGEAYGCGKPDCTVGCECDRYIEVWNIVFSQFNNDGNNNYTELAQKNIDTGMGLERLAVVCQGVDSLFDVDTVMNITNKVSEITGAKYNQSHKEDVSLRVITDHIRSAIFMTGDGVLPSNEGRGYVLRRLLRRAARHGKLLGVNEPFLYKVCDMVIHENRNAYPDLVEKQSYITRVIKTEEENFARTIDGGMKILADLMDTLKAGNETRLSGADAFRLYDTYGFPLDLTEDILEDAGMTADTKGFNALMNEQRERARAARGDMSDAWAGLDLGLDNTPTGFVGYDTLHNDGKILALVVDDELRPAVGAGAEAVIVLDKTPFYAEMGGQSADQGKIENASGEGVFAVKNVLKNKGGKYLHYGIVQKGEINVNEEVFSTVDESRRQAIKRAHSATHLLQAALVSVLGDHVHQAGSLVEPDRLRFDFTHFSAMTQNEIKAAERFVNDSVLDGKSVSVCEMPIDEAKAGGATALFGEKYGSTVRVVTMGDVSKELCGGTHVDNTAKVGPFRIESEFSVASGVRRIEAVTGHEFLRSDEELRTVITKVADALRSQPSEIVHRAESLTSEMRGMKQKLEQLQDKLRAGETAGLLSSAKEVGGLKVVAVKKNEASADDLRRMGDFFRDRDENVVAVLASVDGDKITFLAVCGKNAVSKGVKAGDIIRFVTELCGGKGGGKPDSAMGGGKDVAMLDKALAKVEGFVAEKLGL